MWCHCRDKSKQKSKMFLECRNATSACPGNGWYNVGCVGLTRGEVKALGDSDWTCGFCKCRQDAGDPRPYLESALVSLKADLESLGLVEVFVAPNGNCLFLAVLVSMHSMDLVPDGYDLDADVDVTARAMPQELRAAAARARKDVCTALSKKPAIEVSPFLVDETPKQHLRSMKQDGTYAGELELTIIASLFDIHLVVYYAYGGRPAGSRLWTTG